MGDSLLNDSAIGINRVRDDAAVMSCFQMHGSTKQRTMCDDNTCVLYATWCVCVCPRPM